MGLSRSDPFSLKGSATHDECFRFSPSFIWHMKELTRNDCVTYIFLSYYDQEEDAPHAHPLGTEERKNHCKYLTCSAVSLILDGSAREVFEIPFTNLYLLRLSQCSMH